MKKLYNLMLKIKSNKNDITTHDYIKNGSKKELMDFIKTFKDKQLRVQLTKLLDSDTQKIKYLNTETDKSFELSKVEYKRVNKIDPHRCNKYGENIQEKRDKQQGKIKDRIKKLSKILIDELLNSEELKKEIIKLEIQRLKHEIKGGNPYKIDEHKVKQLDDKIVYTKDLGNDVQIVLETSNGKLKSILINYKNLFTISKETGLFNEYTFRISFFRNDGNNLDLTEIKDIFEEILEIYNCD